MHHHKALSTKNITVGKIFTTNTIQVKNRFELLDTAEKTPGELWQEIQSTMIGIAEEHIPHKKPEKKCKWLSEEITKIAEQIKASRQMRSKNTECSFPESNKEG